MVNFEKLYAENQGLVFGYLRRLCRDESLAEELTQETFFRAYMNLASLRKEESAPSWLCQIAKNAYFAWYNSQKRHSSLELSEELQSPESLEETVVRKELGRQAMEALENLEEPYRTVFALAALEDVPLGEISRRFRKSESWARVIYHRAGKKLAERMKDFL